MRRVADSSRVCEDRPAAACEPRVFISYSRRGGRASAEAFERRLVTEAGLTSWRGLKDVVGGEGIRAQALEAIETCKHLVLILTSAALASTWVKREWTHARLHGKKISPILADRSLKKSDLPGWMRRPDLYDIDDAERWDMLVSVCDDQILVGDRLGGLHCFHWIATEDKAHG